MIVTVMTVHPSVTVVRQDDREFEIPTSAFSQPPAPGQTWNLTLTHQPSPTEQLAELNDYLNPA